MSGGPWRNRASWDFTSCLRSSTCITTTVPGTRPAFHPFWDGVAELGIPVFFSLKPRRAPESESYAAELETMVRWAKRYPDVPVVMTHGLQWRSYMTEDSLEIPDDVFVPFDHPNLHLQFLFPIALGASLGLSRCRRRGAAIEKCARIIGAERLMWGTDMPIVMRFWTYRQCIDQIRRHSDFLSERERDMILGGTVARLLGVD